MKLWKAFINVTLGTVMPREEARLPRPEAARAKREEPVVSEVHKPEAVIVSAPAPERVMRDITVPERVAETRIRRKVKKIEEPAPDNGETIS